MDLTKRLDRLDGEVKLLKNEIKRVLLEIQEQVLRVEDPFSGPRDKDDPRSSGTRREREQPQARLRRAQARPAEEGHGPPSAPPAVNDQAAQGEPELELSRERAKEHVPVLDAGPGAGPASYEFVDLGTMAALAQWTENIVRKIGLGSLERLLDLAVMRGKVSPTRKRIVLSLATLLGSRGQGEDLSAREMLSWMAQLDALLAPRTAADAMLVQFLLQGKLEDMPLARR